MSQKKSKKPSPSSTSKGKQPAGGKTKADAQIKKVGIEIEKLCRDLESCLPPNARRIRRVKLGKEIAKKVKDLSTCLPNKRPEAK